MEVAAYVITLGMPALAYALAMLGARMQARHATSLERCKAGTLRAATKRETQAHIKARLHRIAVRQASGDA
jgi:hypothetical protein